MPSLTSWSSYYINCLHNPLLTTLLCYMPPNRVSKRIIRSCQIGNYLAGHVLLNRKLFCGTVPPNSLSQKGDNPKYGDNLKNENNPNKPNLWINSRLDKQEKGLSDASFQVGSSRKKKVVLKAKDKKMKE